MNRSLLRAAPRRVLPALLLAAVALAVNGCGFQLRGSSIDAAIESFYVGGDPRIDLRATLREDLRRSGAVEASRAADAELVIALLDQRQSRRSVSTTGNARAAEYELEVGVLFQLTDSAGQPLTDPEWMQRERVFRVDRDNIVGNNEEQSLILREMRRDIVQGIIRVTNAVARRTRTGAAGAAGAA